jgi:thymidylate synthase (FAD)
MFLTRIDRELIVRLMEHIASAGRARAALEDFLAVQPEEWAALRRSRERDECRDKLIRLGILEAPAAESGDETSN